ncbi:MAG TPA: hypothetical protein VGX23_36920 [Actinocrinis sp.]|nr:hypothetical protein [Actinocrinis sp.]
MSTAPVDGYRPIPLKPDRTVEELIREKGAKPIESIEDFLEPGVFSSDEGVDEFNAAVREWRNASLA